MGQSGRRRFHNPQIHRSVAPWSICRAEGSRRLRRDPWACACRAGRRGWSPVAGEGHPITRGPLSRQPGRPQRRLTDRYPGHSGRAICLPTASAAGSWQSGTYERRRPPDGRRDIGASGCDRAVGALSDLVGLMRWALASFDGVVVRHRGESVPSSCCYWDFSGLRPSQKLPMRRRMAPTAGLSWPRPAGVWARRAMIASGSEVCAAVLLQI